MAFTLCAILYYALLEKTAFSGEYTSEERANQGEKCVKNHLENHLEKLYDLEQLFEAIPFLSLDRASSHRAVSSALSQGEGFEKQSSIASKRKERLVVDISTDQARALLEQLSCEPNLEKVVYYDNYEPYVAGGYSARAQEMIDLGDHLLLAHGSLRGLQNDQEQPIKEPSHKTHLGYFPTHFAQQLQSARQLLAEKKQVQDQRARLFGEAAFDAQVIVLLGGANSAYFEEFEYFIKTLEALATQESLQASSKATSAAPKRLIVLQSHPRAAERGNDDQIALEVLEERAGKSLARCGIHLYHGPSHSTMKVLEVASRVLYHQTTLAPQVAMAGIPIARFGRDPKGDTMTKALYPQIESASKLSHYLDGKLCGGHLKKLEQDVGMDSRWQEHLVTFFLGF